MARVEDVTERLLRDTSGPGDRVRRVHTTKGATKLSPTLAAFFEKWRAPSDKTIGWISNALAYSHQVEGSKPSYHANMIRLIKGGHIRVCQVDASAPAGSNARRESPFGEGRYYMLRAGSCPTEIDPQASTLGRGRRRR